LRIAWSRICARRMDESQLRCRFPERKCQIITLTVYHHHVLLILMENGIRAPQSHTTFFFRYYKNTRM
jgi:hypothetical protein